MILTSDLNKLGLFCLYALLFTRSQQLFYSSVAYSAAVRVKRCAGFGFDSRRGFACDM